MKARAKENYNEAVEALVRAALAYAEVSALIEKTGKRKYLDEDEVSNYDELLREVEGDLFNAALKVWKIL